MSDKYKLMNDDDLDRLSLMYVKDKPWKPLNHHGVFIWNPTSPASNQARTHLIRALREEDWLCATTSILLEMMGEMSSSCLLTAMCVLEVSNRDITIACLKAWDRLNEYPVDLDE